MLYGQVDGTSLRELVRGRGNGVATYYVFLRNAEVNPTSKKSWKRMPCSLSLSLSLPSLSPSLPPPPPPFSLSLSHESTIYDYRTVS